MIRFACTKCGRLIRTAEKHAGKQGRCPGCKQVLVIPSPEHVFDAVEPQQPGKPPSICTGSLQFENRPVRAGPLGEPSTPAVEQAVAAGREQPPAERKLPWLIDIFLYPCSKSGLVMLVVFTGVPFAFKVLSWFIEMGMLSLPALLPFYLLFGIIGWIVKVVIVLYVYWYLAECIRASADGRIRAPDTTAITPGLWEIIWQIIKIILCLLIFVFPAAVYFYKFREVDVVFIVLAGSGAFLLPMALLSVVMFDSLSGLNPVIIVGSIFSTFLPYLAMAVFLSVFAALSFIVLDFVGQRPVFTWITTGLSIYLMMVGAHILGRFCFRYEERLNWDV
jgi:phage FluMu protein Com